MAEDEQAFPAQQLAKVAKVSAPNEVGLTALGIL